MKTILLVIALGIGATAITDIWGALRYLLIKTPFPNYGLVGRWFGHMLERHFVHAAIGKSAPIRGERVIGWLAHYSIGIIFAATLIVIWGIQWLANPTLGPALITGAVTVVAPFLIMQPAMGAGVASAKAANPNTARFHSLLMHLVFGLGLYTSGLIIQRLCWVL